jgi:catechol 2,3-dioxygenase-like lactoylglutathione lyase family enzyme
MTERSLSRLSLFVSDIDRSATFYEAIGIEFVSDDDPGYARSFDGRIDDTTLELVEATGRRSITHVALTFRVSDIAAAVTRLDDLGYEWHCMIPDYVIVTDPDGNVVSILQETTDLSNA